jgi:DsbC/DsbD-like thiol-disulfide interchange protein
MILIDIMERLSRANHISWRQYLGSFFILSWSVFFPFALAAAAIEVKDQNEAASDLVRAELFSPNAWVQPGSCFHLWLRLTIAKGWHIYWKNPGDSGLPTEISWRLPAGLQLEEMLWPWPKRILAEEATSFGYEGEVFFLSRFSVSAAFPCPSAASLRAEINYLVCREGCLPGSTSVEITLPVKSDRPTKKEMNPSLFDEARLLFPEPLTGFNTRAEVKEEKIMIYFYPEGGRSLDLEGAEFFWETEGLADYSAPPIWRQENGSYLLELKRSAASAVWPPVIKAVLVLKSNETKLGQKAFDLHIPVKNY